MMEDELDPRPGRPAPMQDGAGPDAQAQPAAAEALPPEWEAFYEAVRQAARRLGQR
ncbi:hypothetical protein ACTHPH_15525 [Paenibacillus pasadenensis]|uniref:hypothetical protein n=1 Tax=Paenibacillus TaxID=44249 RepID=UPI0003FA51CC|nr:MULTISPECIES: hypothetical protein [Paenibacillus]QGG55593.1 hypothetical protein GE073_08455 [Paenibacillus sp. B01]